ncbi:MAG TPA: endonuclease III domain-containing protein [Candidatus Eisenbacteria bacterium]|nr:endonuclease III domain-containing protein [Candidatus Eisenbacteria bacterium]
MRAIFRKLSRSWGPQHWWPAETPLEVIVGAILTQNTSWTNVERALTNLRSAGSLSVGGIRKLPIDELEQLVRPSGYFRQKAQRLKDFVQFLDASYSGSLELMFADPAPQLREALLAQKGIGPETADSILLYAGHQPTFVVDAYTRRILERHGAIGIKAKYGEIRTLVEQALQKHQPPATAALDPRRPLAHPPSAMSTQSKPALAQRYNEMHGLFVQLGKHYCVKRNPKCGVCPLGSMLDGPLPPESKPRTRQKATGDRRQASGKPAKSRL